MFRVIAKHSFNNLFTTFSGERFEEIYALLDEKHFCDNSLNSLY